MGKTSMPCWIKRLWIASSISPNGLAIKMISGYRNFVSEKVFNLFHLTPLSQYLEALLWDNPKHFSYVIDTNTNVNDGDSRHEPRREFLSLHNCIAKPHYMTTSSNECLFNSTSSDMRLLFGTKHILNAGLNQLIMRLLLCHHSPSHVKMSGNIKIQFQCCVQLWRSLSGCGESKSHLMIGSKRRRKWSLILCV